MPIPRIQQKAARVKSKLTTKGTKFTVRGKGDVYGFFSTIDNSKLPATLVDVVDTAIVVEPNVSIATDDYILYGSEKFKVVRVSPVRPDGTLLLYEVLLKS